jgi:simple sugar transport system substrate-binding protein
MNYKSILAGVLLALGLGTAVSAADVKVGFVYVGPIGDGGWTYEHDKGRLAVEKHFGDRVETIYQESVPEGADSERVMTTMAMQGADLIFTTSFRIHGPHHKCCEKISKRKI